MKSHPLPLILLTAGFTLATVSATRAALVIHYTFNGNATIADGNTIVNVAGGTNGTFDLGTDAGNTAAIVPSGVTGGFGGNALRITPANDGLGNSAAPNIVTGYLVTNGIGSSGLISNAKVYTAMAWVNFGSATGDNFIFGGSNPPSGSDQMLHHGSRGGNLHSAHWGDDIGPDQGFNVSSQAGSWHHVAYTNDGAAGNQSIYWDGNLVVGPGATGFNGNLAASAELFIGTSFGSGSFSGLLDEVRVYDTLLTQQEIVAAMTVIPEPGSAVLAGLIGVGGLMLRRRRAAH